MKICEKCGAHNSDDRMFCVDCGDTLGDKLSDLEEQQMQQDMQMQIEKLYAKTDPLYVSLLDKIVGGISVVGVVVSLVLLVMRWVTKQDIEYLWLGVGAFLLSAIEAFVPALSWEIEKARLGYYVNGGLDDVEIEPSDFYVIGRKITIIGFSLLGILVIFIKKFSIFM